VNKNGDTTMVFYGGHGIVSKCTHVLRKRNMRKEYGLRLTCGSQRKITHVNRDLFYLKINTLLRISRIISVKCDISRDGFKLGYGQSNERCNDPN
jgi:hypothetical protein